MRRLACTTVSALAAAALAGCGGDDEDEAGAPQETTREQPPAETEPAPNATEPPAAQARSCGDVAFQEDTDAGAFDIRATGVSCEVAREVAGAAEGEDLRYRAEGFRCTGTRQEDELPSVVYTCVRDGERVRFTAS